jgi:hypothetical protein
MWRPAFFWTFIDVSKERNAHVFNDNESWGSEFQEIIVKFLPNYEAYHSRGGQFSTVIIPRNFGRALDVSGLQQNKLWHHVFFKFANYALSKFLCAALKIFLRVTRK